MFSALSAASVRLWEAKHMQVQAMHACGLVLSVLCVRDFRQCASNKMFARSAETAAHAMSVCLELARLDSAFAGKLCERITHMLASCDSGHGVGTTCLDALESWLLARTHACTARAHHCLQFMSPGLEPPGCRSGPRSVLPFGCVVIPFLYHQYRLLRCEDMETHRKALNETCIQCMRRRKRLRYK